MILNLTAVMTGPPSSQHAQDLTELCSGKYAIITRTLDESRCVEPSEGKLECRRYLTMCSEELLGGNVPRFNNAAAIITWNGAH